MASLTDGIFKSLCSELNQLSDVAINLGSLGSPKTRFEDIYQQSRCVESQDDRRRRILKEYRTTKRDDTLLKKYAAVFAEACEAVKKEVRTDFNSEEALSLKETTNGARTPGVPKQSPQRKAKNKFPRLMLSEWLLEVPSDFEDSWIMIPCPVGKRCSVVTCRGETFVYSRTGLHMLTGTSDLPGGSSTKRQGTNFTVLDCVFDSSKKLFHVLDVLFWNGSSLVDNTFEFRLFWLASRLAEIESLFLTTDSDKFELVSLPQCTCASEDLASFFTSTSRAALIDGYLFYHKDGLYISDTTPMVCWLKPWMISEIVRIPVPEGVMKEKPADYTTLANHVAVLEAKHPKKIRKKFTNNAEEAMDMDEISDHPLNV